jgi:hypothetical protein
MPIRPKAEKQNIPPQRRKGHERRIFTTKAQRAQREKDASHKRRGHGEKRAMICGLSVLDLSRP